MKLRPLLLAGVAMGLILPLRGHAQGLLQELVLRMRALGPWGPAAIIAAHIVASALFMPGAVLTLGALDEMTSPP